jgi:hypothetical protein
MTLEQRREFQAVYGEVKGVLPDDGELECMVLGYQLGLTAAIRLADNIYGSSVGVVGNDTPGAVGLKIASALHHIRERLLCS